ncbi:MAG: arsenate reductase ArsC [Gemmatimonadaceae bacterium]
MIAQQEAAKSLSVLFLCTHNSARSQIAEALFVRKAERAASGRYRVASAGSTPGQRVHPGAVRALNDYGIDWAGKRPKSIDDVNHELWDLVITVCDRAKEACPTMPGQPAYAHWGMDDPSEMTGPEQDRAFKETLTHLSRRIDLLLSIPFETLERRALETRVQGIADEAPVPRRVATP